MVRCARLVGVVSSAALVVTATIGSTDVGAGTSGPRPGPDKTIAPTSVPSTVVRPTAAPSTTVAMVAPPPSPTTKFDSLAFLSAVFDAMQADYFDISEIATEWTVSNSPANWILVYLLGIALAADENGGPAPPVYSAAPSADGLGVDVCRPAEGICDVFADFVVVDGLLSSFTINGVDITGRLGSSTSAVSASTLEFTNAVALDRPSDDALGIVVLLSAGDEDVQIAWDRAVYLDPTGTKIPVTGLVSYSPELSARRLGSASLIVGDADLGGELVVTVSTDDFATSERAVLPILPVS